MMPNLLVKMESIKLGVAGPMFTDGKGPHVAVPESKKDPGGMQLKQGQMLHHH